MFESGLFAIGKGLGFYCRSRPDLFIPGRSIFSNLSLLRDTLAFIERTRESGILLSLDQEKAFDRVDSSFLLNLIEHFGFGPWFRACIATLYKGAYMQILVNDFLSNPVPLLRGVRQGDALSPMLYILCVEALACKFEQLLVSKAFSFREPGENSSRLVNTRTTPQLLLKMKSLWTLSLM